MNRSRLRYSLFRTFGKTCDRVRCDGQKRGRPSHSACLALQADGASIMKTKTLILFVTLTWLPVVLNAQNALTYATNNGAVTVTGYVGARSSVTNVVIPATVGGYPVVGIGNYAFSSCTSLTSLISVRRRRGQHQSGQLAIHLDQHVVRPAR